MINNLGEEIARREAEATAIREEEKLEQIKMLENMYKETVRREQIIIDFFHNLT